MRLFFIILFLPAIGFAQLTSGFQKEKVIWDPPASAVEVKNENLSSDLVYLSDYTDLYLKAHPYSGTILFDFFKSEASFMYWDDVGHQFTRKVRVKILTEKGLSSLKNIRIPESFDPGYDFRPDRFFVSYDESGKVVHGDVIVNFFGARVYNPDRTIKEILVKDSVIDSKLLFYSDVRTLRGMSFNPRGLKVGDEVEFYYQYVVPDYAYLSSDRYFFSGAYPVQDYSFKLSFDRSKVYIVVNSFNGAGNGDSTVVQDKGRNLEVRTWKFADLKPAPVTAGRPYLDQKHILLYKHRLDIRDEERIEEPHLSNAKPYTWGYLIRKRSIKYRKNPEEYDFSKTDASTKGYNRYFSKWRTEGGDTSRVVAMSNIHNELNKLRFKSNLERFKENNTMISSPAEMFDKNIIREFDVYDAYQNFLDRFRRPYFSIVLPDNRINDHDPKVYFPVTAVESGYALPVNGGYVYFLPRTRNSTYLVNEFPFYYENSTALFLPKNLHKDAIGELDVYSPRFNKIPGSELADNKRTTILQIRCNLDSLKIVASGQVMLAGQYSTLTRDFYASGAKDPSINPDYFQKVSGIRGASNVKESMTLLNKDFPFNAKVDTKFGSESFISKKENRFVIPLGNMIHAVFYDHTAHKNSAYRYRADFAGSDTYKFQIAFSDAVEISNIEGFNKNISNQYADLSSRLLKQDDKTYFLEVSYRVKSPVVETSELVQVEEINSALTSIMKWEAEAQKK